MVSVLAGKLISGFPSRCIGQYNHRCIALPTQAPAPLKMSAAAAIMVVSLRRGAQADPDRTASSPSRFKHLTIYCMTTDLTAVPDPAGRRGKLHGAAVETVRAMIVSGQIRPGDPLREKELCEELGISRTPLREAIRTLAREGLVKLYPNRSAICAEVDISEIGDLFQAISHIESLGAVLTCQRATDSEIEAIFKLHNKMMKSFDDRNLRKYIVANQAIHRKLMVASRNVVLLELWELLVPRVERARSLANLESNRWNEAAHEHEEMLVALKARDGDTLASLMSEHYLKGLLVLRHRAANPT
jgi:DNA-binding GntR family transcriptional regulator